MTLRRCGSSIGNEYACPEVDLGKPGEFDGFSHGQGQALGERQLRWTWWQWHDADTTTCVGGFRSPYRLLSWRSAETSPPRQRRGFVPATHDRGLTHRSMLHEVPTVPTPWAPTRSRVVVWSARSRERSSSGLVLEWPEEMSGSGDHGTVALDLTPQFANDLEERFDTFVRFLHRCRRGDERAVTIGDQAGVDFSLRFSRVGGCLDGLLSYGFLSRHRAT